MKPLLLVLVICGLARADWREDLAPASPGSHPRLEPVTLSYALSWKGLLDAGHLDFTFGLPDPKHPQDYKISAWGGSSGLASTLFPYKISLNSFLDPKELRTRRFKGVEIEDDEITVTESTFLRSRVRSTKSKRPNKKAAEYKTVTEFRFAPTLDGLAALLHVRSQTLEGGDTLHYALVPFNSPYLASIHVAGREFHRGRPSIKLELSIRKIDPKSLALLPYKKLKSATLWISDDADRIPIELRSEVFIGDVRMVLKEVARQ